MSILVIISPSPINEKCHQTSKLMAKTFLMAKDVKFIFIVIFLVAEQLYIWSCLSVRASVCLSVPNLCPWFLTEALQLMLDSGLFSLQFIARDFKYWNNAYLKLGFKITYSVQIEFNGLYVCFLNKLCNKFYNWPINFQLILSGIFIIQSELYDSDCLLNGQPANLA